MSYNRCKDTRKFGNKYLPSAYKTQVDFRSHFSGEKSASYSPRNTVNSQIAAMWKCLGKNKSDKINHIHDQINK